MLACSPCRQIPRADVAELAVQALVLPQARNRAVDAVSEKPEAGTVPTKDFSALYSEMTDNCDYTIQSQLELRETVKV